jgi:WD40 repeat protein
LVFFFIFFLLIFLILYKSSLIEQLSKNIYSLASPSIKKELELSNVRSSIQIPQNKLMEDNNFISWIQSVPYSEERIRKYIFNGQVIQSFKGHANAIRCIDVLSNESLFITGSRDSTVKIWSLDQSNCKLTYSDHSNPLNHAKFLNNGSLVASCATSIHVCFIFLF